MPHSTQRVTGIITIIVAMALQGKALNGQQGGVFTPEISTDRTQRTLLEVRLAEFNPRPGWLPVTVATPPRGGLAGRVVYISDDRIITNNDVMQASVLERSGIVSIGITLSAEGAERMAAATASHRDKPLVMIVNGQAVSAPVVRDQIRGEVVLTGTFSREQAERVASGLNR